MPLAVCAALLCGCAPMTPAMWGKDTVSRAVEVDGARWRVDFTAAEAEAHRTNIDLRLARAPMVARGARAIELATGCALKPRSVRGDQAIVRARLDCNGQQPDKQRKPPPARIACVIDERVPGSRAPEVVMSDCVVER